MVQNADVLALTKSKGVSAEKKVANSLCILITRTYGTFEVMKWKIIQKIVLVPNFGIFLKTDY